MNVGKQCLKILKSNVMQNYFHCLGRTLAYKSAFSLDKLYPTSNLRIYTPNFVPEDSNAKFNGYIPLNELDITYCRSTGAGGQHVNCVNTKVELRFNVQNAKWLSEEIKQKLLQQYENRLTKTGCIVIKSELTRSQQLNQADALQKLRTLIYEAIKPPVELSAETIEMLRKRKLAAARKRLHEKRQRSEIKRSRHGHNIDF